MTIHATPPRHWQTDRMKEMTCYSASSHPLIRMIRTRCLRYLASVVLACTTFTGVASAQNVSASNEQTASALTEKHAELAAQLAGSPYGRPLYLESAETSNTVNGNAYAVLDSPFSAVSATLKSPKRWCDVMILHINTKFCQATSDASPSVLKVNVGKKTEQELADAFALEFSFRLASASPTYLSAQLNADQGPLGTSNYRIDLRAIPLPEGKTFMHLRYSYGYGVAGKIALQGYLATLGRGKVGFTQVGQDAKQTYVGGMRGAVERNTMRYYLAIEAYMSAIARPPEQQLNARLDHWFNATEQYARQLHEVDKSSYLVMKKNEYQRQQNGS